MAIYLILVDIYTFAAKLHQYLKANRIYPDMKVPVHTQSYANKSLKRLHSATPKCQAIELSLECAAESVPVLHQPTSHAQPTPVTPSGSLPMLPATLEARLQQLENIVMSHGATLKFLELCCTKLAQSSQQLTNHLEDMSREFTDEFDDISNALEKPTMSPSRRQSKHHKDHHGLPDVNLN
jgi:hypothetical protein